MEDKVVSMKDFKKEAFKRKVKEKVEKVKDKVSEGIGWMMDHPAETIGIISGLGLVATKAAKIKQVNAEDRRRATDFYDNRLGTHAIARRPLTNKEALEVERRYTQNKESYKSILYDMKLLK